MKMAVFWVVAACFGGVVFESFSGAWWLHHQGDETRLHGATTQKTAIFGLFIIQSYRKQVPNGRSRIGRSGWGLGQWELCRPCGAKLDVTGALLEDTISSLHFFEILETSSTAFGISVSLPSLLVFLGCWVRGFYEVTSSCN
jgi:hypothetical protein